MKKKYALIALGAIVLFMGLSYTIYKFNEKPLSFVSISINPDLMLGINEDNIVKEVMTINEDADIITSDLNLVGMKVEEASEKVVDAAIETGFIDEYSDENTVVVTVTGGDEGVRSTLENKVVEKLQQRLEVKEIYAVIVANGLTDDLKEEAEEYDISNGKMLLVNRAVSVNSELSKEELAQMTVQEIQQEIKKYVTERRESLKESLQELKTKWKEEKATLKEEYRNKVEQLKDKVLKEENINTNNMTEVQKDAALSNILKEKKRIIKERIDEVTEEVRDTVKNKTYPAVKETINAIRERIKNGSN